MSIENRIKELNIKLPDAPSPVGSYVAHKTIGKLVFISGQISIDENGKIIKGKVGKDIDIETSRKAAYQCGINILSQIKAACNGDLSKIKNCVKITGFVNSTDDFFDQPKVINAASELISNLLKDKGIHSRAAISVNSLPLNAAVEIDAIFEIN